MKRSKFWIAGGLIVCLISSIVFAAVARQTKTLAQADKDYQQKSYKRALEGYVNLFKAGIVPTERKDEVQYRIAVSLGRTEQWYRALQTSLDFVKAHQGTVWEPRGLYWLGRLTVLAPKNGYRVGKKLYRGNNVPKATGNERAEAVNLQQQDSQQSLEAMEAARILYTKLHSQNTTAEEIQLDFDLALLLQSDPRFAVWGSEKKWTPPADSYWQINTAQTYSLDWEPPKKLMYLYAHIASLNPKSHSAALAKFGEAIWLRGYQRQMLQNYALRYEKGKTVKIPYPYQEVKPATVLRGIATEFPNDPLSDQAEYTIALFQQQDGEPASALNTYRALIARRPQSSWAGNSHLQIQSILKRQLSLNAQGSQIFGKPATLDISTTNIAKVQFRAYSVPLESAFSQSKFIRKPDMDTQDIKELFGGIDQIERRFGKPIIWEKAVKDKKDYRSVQSSVSLPLTHPGAYIIVASSSGIKTSCLVMLTDMVVVRKISREGVLLYATDARRGKPIEGANLLARISYYDNNPKGEQTRHAQQVTGLTDRNGLYNISIPRKTGRSNFAIASLSSHAGSYAITSSDFNDFSDFGNDNQGRFKSYCTTDRSVYRPYQIVHYRDVVMERQRGLFKPVAGKKIHVEVTDPKGQKIHTSLLTSSEFGSVNGQFALSAEAPLGEYNLQATVYKTENAPTESGGNQFRVEEYKKPEYEVAVVPEAERVRLGEPTSVKVSAKYYFGGPVPNAKVTYRVHRNSYAQTYQFPQPFDFLYKDNSAGAMNTDFRNGDVISQGTAVTDAKGEAKITFPTKTDDERWKDQDLSYTVEADVKDSSRRTITGSGTVKATRHDVAVFLNYPHGYSLKGDRVDVEAVTLNPSDQPISVEGEAVVYRRPETPDGKVTRVYRTPLVTDKSGRVIIHWQTEKAGYYRVAFETHDTAGASLDPYGKVEGSTDIWVEGSDLANGRFKHQGVFLAVKNPYYQKGETAKLLIVAPQSDCNILLTREANNEILEKRIVHVPGRSLEVNLPLGQKDVPNIYVSAVMVRNGEMFTATQELFVPPVSQLAKVSVQADKAKYQPGEKAHFSLHVTDWQGLPLRTELAVSVSDASLTYIQKSYAPDIRIYYYGDRRSQSVEASGSNSSSFQELTVDRQKYKNYKEHSWSMPEGMGLLYEEFQIREGRHRAPRDSNGIQPYAFSDVEPVRLAFGRNVFGSAGVYQYQVAGVIQRRRAPGDAISSSNYLFWEGSITAKVPRGYDAMSVRRWSFPAIGMIDDGKRIETDPSYSGLSNMQYAKGELAAPKLRSKFVDTAFWMPAVVTNKMGEVSVDVTWPDNLTQWHAQAIGNSAQAQVGTAETQVTTRKDLLVRLEAPRYFVERDEMIISANVQNYTEGDAHVKVSIDLGSDAINLESQGRGKREEGRVNHVSKQIGRRQSARSTTLSRSSLLPITYSLKGKGNESASDSPLFPLP